MKQILVILFFLISVNNIRAQEANCKVMPDSLKGTYTGDCKDGKANGQGKAVGTDTYEGWFVKGYPEGKGMYTWKDGHYFIGQFKKGKLDGKGDMYYENAKGGDSVVTGFWKKDIYTGKYEKPYSIENATSDIGRIDVSTFKSGKSTIKIEVRRMSGGGFATSTGSTNNSIADVSKPIRLSDIRVQTGIYLVKSVNTLSDSEIIYLQSVRFPFRATFVFGNSSFEMEFFEDGEWNVTVPIKN
jgi:hypothetical protein